MTYNFILNPTIASKRNGCEKRVIGISNALHIDGDLKYQNDRLYFAGRQLLLKAVNRVWIELIHSKKQVLEDMFKVTFAVNDRGHVDIAVVRPFIEEATLRSWQNHLSKSFHGERIFCCMRLLLVYSQLCFFSTLSAVLYFFSVHF